MGESIVESLNAENKMRESLAPADNLELSISFGRFENDSLSWEKWSSFSPNKYLEEVGKCSTPGSVAQKKAYFEAHYKKIAAKKAEQVEQEKQIETDYLMKDDQSGEDEQVEQEKQIETNYLMKDDQSGEDDAGNTFEIDTVLGIVNVQSSAEGVEKVNNSIDVMSSNSNHSDESNENATITIECQSSSVDGAKEELDTLPESLELNKSEEAAVLGKEGTYKNGSHEDVKLPPLSIHDDTSHLNGPQEKLNRIPESLELNKSKEPVLIQESIHKNGSQESMKLSPLLVQDDASHLNGPQEKVQLLKGLEEIGKSLKNKKENAKFRAPNKSQEVTPTKNERNLAGTKKKSTSPLLKKSPQISTPKASKPPSTSMVVSASRSSMKKPNDSPLPRSRIPSAGENKKMASSSLHMSLSLGPANSESNSLTPSRKSLIMEKMGDKEIVRRAFKTFQNNFNLAGSSAYERSSGQKEVSTKGPQQKLSTSLTPRKENEGIRKAAERDAQRGQLARSWNSGSLKGAVFDQRNAKPAPSSFGLRTNDRADKPKEKLGGKSYAKEAEKTHLRSKSKGEKEAEIKKLRQSLTFKATPMPGFYRGHVITKSHLDKEGAKNELHRRPEMHR